jgi:hypothetical protein
LKISAKDVTKWLASHNIKKVPSDLTPTEVEQVAKDLKVDKQQLERLIATTTFETEPVKAPVAQNKLNGELNQGAVVVYQRGIWDTD